ncbi:MAG: TonB-dependent receptor [Deltaproteobacteria bacterium]|jgi:vitamin B12 transporter|nr:TonB-dependent receptor [Deltaproteobacteria bacterium]
MKLNAQLTAAALAAAFAAALPAVTASAQEAGAGRLDAVIVSATRSEDTIRDLPISPVIIGEEEIQRHPNSDLGDILERAGIMVDRQYYFGGQVVIRGLSGNISGSDVQSDVLMLLNGHRIGTGSLMRFPAKNIERIEVIRGPAALQFGSASMGGVVNVITRRGKGPVTFFAEAGVGEWDQHEYSGAISGSYGGFDFSAGGSELGRHADYQTGGDGLTYLGTQTKSRSEGSAQVGYTFAERHRLAAIGTWIDLEHFGFTGPIDSMYSTGMGTAPNYQNKTSGTGRFLDLIYEGGTPGGTFSWEARYFTGKDEQGGNAAPLAHYVNKLDGAQARITGEFPEIGTEVTLGYDLTKYDFETSSSNLGKYRYSDQGIYLVFKKYLMEGRLVLSGGARLNMIDTDTPNHGGNDFSENKLTPALGATYVAADWIKIRANYAKGYRAPSVNEMFGRGSTMLGRYYYTFSASPMMPPVNIHTVWLEPNPDLKPQESDSFEIGVDVDRDFFTGSLTLFYSLFKGKIERFDTPYPAYYYEDAVRKWPWIAAAPPNARYTGLPVGFPNSARTATMGGGFSGFAAYASYTNFADAKQLGLEWDLRYDVGRQLGWGLSVTPYSHGTWLPVSKYTSGPENGLRMHKVPRVFTSYGIQLESEERGLFVDVNFLTKSMQRTSVLTSDDLPKDTQPGWTIMNVRFSKTLLDGGNKGTVSLVGLVSNVTDVYYESTPEYPLPGRGFFVGLRYDYR